MGILLDQELQKLNSFSNRQIEDDEKDIHLNTEINRFVDDTVGKLRPNIEDNFDENQRLLDSIHTLVEKDVVLDTFIHSKGVSYGILPYNYRHLIADSSELTIDCHGNKDKQQYEVIRWLSVFSILADNVATKKLQLEHKRALVFNSDPYNRLYLDDVDSHFELHNAFKHYTKGFYYENFNGVVYPNAFVSISNTNDKYKLTVNEVASDIDVKELKFKKYKESSDTNIIANRLLSTKHLRKALNSVYDRTGADSPVSNLANNILYVYEDDTFYVNNIYIDYVREPARVSHKLGINCDLPSNMHEIIVKNTAIHIKNLLADESIKFNSIEKQLNN